MEGRIDEVKIKGALDALSLENIDKIIFILFLNIYN